jgi:endoglucanase
MALTTVSFPLVPAGSSKNDVTSYYTYWKNKYVKPYNNGVYLWYNDSGDGEGETVSEAHGYLMLTSVLMGDKDTFDKALQYYLLFRDKFNQMKWLQRRNGQYLFAPDADSATDGDIDIIYSLFLASKKWNDPRYLDAAKTGLDGFKKSILIKNLNMMNVGDWAGTSAKLTRTSDFDLSHLYTFSVVDTDVSLWKSVLNTTVNAVYNCFLTNSSSTGLLPDFLVYANNTWSPPAGKVLETKNDGKYSWNACRTFWRLATYLLVNPKAPDENTDKITKILSKANEWIKAECKGDPKNIKAGYSLTGVSLEKYTSLAFVPSFMFCAIAAKDQPWLDKLYKYVLSRNETYYENSIKMLSLVLVNGLYQVIV